MKSIKLNQELLSLEPCKVMGILNVTEDSFFDGGKYDTDTAIVIRANEMLMAGASIIDLGVVSTRPNATPISADQEYRAVKKNMQLLRKYLPHIKISVDTFRANVAQMAIDEGACFINDISGGKDPDMYHVVARNQVPYCLTHNNRGAELPDEELIASMLTFFANEIEKLKELGVNDIVIDPGFGFGKTLEQNYLILRNLHVFKAIDHPLLVGISRKSMIFNVLGTIPEHALTGTSVLHALALHNPVHLLRVHDVKEAQDVIKMMQYWNNPNIEE